LNRIHSFDPIIDSTCDRLVLGSMPGEESLRLQRYYAHPRNHFWRIVYGLYGLEPDEDYPKRVAFALSKGIGLWDVLRECERQGSLDTSITRPDANDFTALLQAFPHVRALFFNGTRAYKDFVRLVVPDLNLNGVALYPLPSSSPAHAVSLVTKLHAWAKLRDVSGEVI
jgi:TDG/mug DNA glycosylase family protein